MPSVTESKKYWRSLEELQDTPEFREMLHREFPVAASEFPSGFSRRRWIQLMGAALSLGGAAGCRWQADHEVTFAVRPKNRIPGVPQKYATSYQVAGVSRGLVVTDYDGRPIKVDGNPQHPQSLGGTDVWSQALVLQMYDPDRSRHILDRTGNEPAEKSWDEFKSALGKLVEAAGASQGKGLRVLSEASSSQTLAMLKAKLLEKLPQARWTEYEPINRDNDIAGAELAFGKPVRTLLDLSKADVILSLDADLFGDHGSKLVNIRQWAARREPKADGGMNRMYVVESLYSTTGANADHRLPLTPNNIGPFLAAVEERVDTHLAGKEPAAAGEKYDGKFLAAVASDLVEAKGKSAVVVGSRQPAAVHALAHRLNLKLENLGHAVLAAPETQAGGQLAAIKDLAAEMAAGSVETLIILGGNPVYNAPADVKFGDALAKVPNSIHLSEFDDETSHACKWHVNRAHAFEAWSDGRSFDGTVTLAQPMIDPLFDGKSDLELVAAILGDDRDGQTLVKAALADVLPKDRAEKAWNKLVHDGFLPDSGLASIRVQLKPDLSLEFKGTAADSTDLTVVFQTDASVYDGRFGNNAWLQETPDIVTKMVWDNAALISPKTAEKLGLKISDLVEVAVGGLKITAPVFIVPGTAQNVVGLALGYGRTHAGHVGGLAYEKVGAVGCNAYALRTTTAPDHAAGAKLTKTGGTYPISTTQDHHAIDLAGLAETFGRIGQLVREGTLEQYEHHPDFAQHMVHHPPLESLWTERSSEGHAWGMSIDLSKCVGCNACMVACQSENNVPIVGKDQVGRNREMHWIRVDRYFSADPRDPDSFDNPPMVTQPVTCQQCENAPCEQVCPVAATVHSPEGLNDMAYNRCIGTRYCANNCPVKVRRFNFFDFNKEYDKANTELQQMVLNPEVTVRERGVMEKCTYCVQRIQNGKIAAKRENNRPLVDGEIRTACQDACPANAIEFGDLMVKENRVAVAHENPRAYAMLAELNIKPRTKYLARIRNPHPSLAPKLADHGHGHGGEEHHDDGHEHAEHKDGKKA